MEKIHQEKEAIETNIQTIRNGLNNHSIVPARFQKKTALNEMVGYIKSEKANSDREAISLYQKKKESELERGNQEAYKMKQKVCRQQRVGGFVRNTLRNRHKKAP